MSEPVFVDTETLGLDPRIHPIWEVALVMDDFEHVWHLDVDRFDRDAADPVAVSISGFDTRYADRLERTSVVSFLDEFIELTAGRHLAGAVVSFDEERLRRLAWQWGHTPKWHYHLIDVEALAVGWLAGRAVPPTLPWNSDALTAALGLPPVPEDERHTALGDARWAKAIYDRCMGR